MRTVSAIAAVVAVVGVAVVPAAASPPRFTARVTNPWFPLRPGTVYVYRGIEDGKRGRDVVTVTHRVARIARVPCAVVEDRVYLRGRLVERTTDWYTQDSRGTVWYYGEDTAELDRHGRVTSREGSWRAGRNGARPGIFMPAHPRVGFSARQEYLKGHAEDHFRVLSVHASAHVPAAASTRALLTREWSPLEPAVVDHKVYVRGIGEVLEETIKGGDERFVLVSVRR